MEIHLSSVMENTGMEQSRNVLVEIYLLLEMKIEQLFYSSPWSPFPLLDSWRGSDGKPFTRSW